MIMPGMGNNIVCFFDAISGRFDHSVINPVQLGYSANEIEAALTQIEQLQEVEDIKNIYKEINGKKHLTIGIIGFILAVCFIGLVCIVYSVQKQNSLNKRLSDILRQLKEKADQILQQYNQNLNAKGQHALTRINDRLVDVATQEFANKYFSVIITLPQSEQQNQQAFQLNQMMQNEQKPFI